jgi:hypothetical protein
MTQTHSRSRQQAEIAFGKTQTYPSEVGRRDLMGRAW